MRVTVMPVIVGFSGQVSSRLGAPVELPCRAVGVLPITYTWTRGNETGTPASITITTTSTTTTTDPSGHLDGGALQISAVRRSDAGHYYCRAENQAGRDQIHTILAVTGESRGGDGMVHMWNMGASRTQASEEPPAISLNGSVLQNHPGMNHSDPAPRTEPLALRPTATLPPLQDTPYGRPRPLGSPNYQPLLARLDPRRSQTTPLPAPPTPNGQIRQPPPSQLDPQTANHTGLPVPSPYPGPHATGSPEPGPRDLASLALPRPLLSLPKSVGSPTRSPDSTDPPTPHPTRGDDLATPANRHGPGAVPLSLALTATSQQATPPRPDAGPQLLHPPTQGPPAEPQLAEDSCLGPEDQTRASLENADLEAMQSPSAPQSAQSSSSTIELPLTSLCDEAEPTPSLQPPPPSSDSSSPPPGSLFPAGPVASSQPEPRLLSSQPQGPFHSPPSVSSTTTTLTPTPAAISSTSTPTTTTIAPTSTTTQAPTSSTTTTTTTTPTAISSTSTPTTTTTQRTTTTTPTTIPSTPTPTQTPITRTTNTDTPTPTTTTPTPNSTITTSTPTINSNPKQATITSTTTTHNTSNVITSRTTASTSTTTTISTPTSASRPSDPGGLRLTTPAAPDGVRSNVSQAADPSMTSGSTSDPRPTVGLKTNISQSPMTSDDPRVTPKTPSWLPGLEKHDIPIVVGVGVSLAFIFITMAFYSLFQNNEPVPVNRAGLAQRNVGVPVRHAERQAPGKTYDNRAFEDDECVAVIEQSPNTSDTRARPLAAGLVLVQMEAPPEDLRENHQLSLMEDRAGSMETFPLGALLDSQVGARVEEEKAFISASPPSSLLHCVEDWVSSSSSSLRPACQDPPPAPRSPPTPPSSLPPPPFSLPPPLSSRASHSPSPTLSLCPSSPSPSSLATVREERLHSSLTLQAPAEHASSAASALPVHHSLSVSHAASSPLLVSHRVSLGSSTTVTVDVTFHPPAATAAMAIATSTHISNTAPGAGPLFNFPLAHESDQSATSMPHGK